MFRSTKQNLLLPAAVFAAMVPGMLAATTSASAQEKTMRFASFRTGSSWYAYAVTFGNVLTKKGPKGWKVDTPPLGGGTANPVLISRGKADVGFGFGLVHAWARDGKVAFKKKISSLRGIVGGLDRMYLGVIVNQKDGPATLGQYLGKKKDPRVMLLRKGSLGALAAQQLLDTLGATKENVEKSGGSYQFTNFENVKSGFASKRADLFIQLMTKGQPFFNEVSQTVDITFLSLSDNLLKKMSKEYGWNVMKFPAKVFRGQDKPLNLLGTSTSVIVDKKMDAQTAYMITKTICENEKEIQAGHKALANFSCKAGAKEELINLPLHDGAKKYYKEQGWLK